MATRLTLHDRAEIASRFNVWNSVLAVQKWWRMTKGRNARIDPKTIKNCHRKLMTTGSLADEFRSGRPTTRTVKNVELVKEMFTRSPQKSTRQAVHESGLSRHTICSVLTKDLNFRPWKPHYVQDLTHEDCEHRMEYGESMLGWHEEWPQLFENILWSDEAVFHTGGFVNRHNSHYWAAHDPEVIVEKMQNRPKVTVWCGMTASRIIGPYLLRDTMNADRYLKMLEEYVWPRICGWENIDELVFMQDGAPPHFARTVRAWLDQKFPERWIGRQGPHNWPARSPDLTPCDFFLWGWAKEKVYQTKPHTLEQLETRIHEVIENVPFEFLQKSVVSINDRLRKLVKNAGAYIEL